MSPKKEFSDIFDEDFEVTYEEEPRFTWDKTGKHSAPDHGRHDNKRFEEYPDPDMQDGYDSDDDYDDYNGYDDPDNSRGRRMGLEDTGSLYDDGCKERPRKSRKNRRGGVPLAAPIKKGGKLLSRISGAFLRQLSLLLILATSAYVTYTFWRASTPYGDIIEVLQKKTLSQSLAAYLSVAAVFLFFEFISLIWTMTRVRVRNGRESWKEDTGRGFLSFIAVFVSSYTAFLFSRFLPDSPEVIYGLKGALDVYGSMHNVLLGLCAAGAVSCLIRRYSSY